MQNAKCRMQNAKCKMQNAKPTLRSERRGQTCLRYAEPRGGKTCEAGLTDAAEREQRANLFTLCRAARRKSLQSRVNAECKAQKYKAKAQKRKAVLAMNQAEFFIKL